MPIGRGRRVQRETARQREEQSLALRAAGATYAQVGQQLGMSESCARRAYLRALGKLPSIADREECRRLEAGRLDRLLTAWWPKALAGDAEAAGIVLKIAGRRARLLGLDTPNDFAMATLMKVISELRALPEEDLLRTLGYDHDPEPGD
jgi:hypothetical protein